MITEDEILRGNLVKQDSYKAFNEINSDSEEFYDCHSDIPVA